MFSTILKKKNQNDLHLFETFDVLMQKKILNHSEAWKWNDLKTNKTSTSFIVLRAKKIPETNSENNNYYIYYIYCPITSYIKANKLIDLLLKNNTPYNCTKIVANRPFYDKTESFEKKVNINKIMNI